MYKSHFVTFSLVGSLTGFTRLGFEHQTFRNGRLRSTESVTASGFTDIKHCNECSVCIPLFHCLLTVVLHLTNILGHILIGTDLTQCTHIRV